MNIYDIAREANVSIATVSRVMNNKQNISAKTRKRVEAVLQKYNYTPSSIARGLASSSMQMVGMVMQEIRNTPPMSSNRSCGRRASAACSATPTAPTPPTPLRCSGISGSTASSSSALPL